MKALWIFMVLFGIGFSAWLVLDTDKRTDFDSVDAGFSLNLQESVLRLQYITGQPLAMDAVTLHIQHDGMTTDVAGHTLGFGDTWDAGETVCIVGPGCILANAREVTVAVGYGGASIFQGSRSL